ncbi:ABC transporter permease [Lachnoclostridium phytofermentans]|uniref:ABC-2 type transporter transmembrane domain-containing protein n=1 Tax=Lachnoclostridium phytofermentans (strain ATCC 700394 / DSM 18823 / ISDg) TaxID=357809 RepID=A9KIH9_LACP7|nr:ABC transporter permease [Lachnoclostridium phytofermentans]ABX42431.1 hypothetical protein Cphy_2063 [Lachnoclostridium phytofermentans ISDg]
MRELEILIDRNITLFRSNKRNVMLSFASIFIVMGLYVIFLRDFILNSVVAYGLSRILAEEFTDRMMVGGLMIVLNTTTCFGIMQLCVEDASTGIRKDFLIAPITEFKIILGYLLSSVLVSGFFTLFTVICAECYFYIRYDNPMDYIALAQVVILVITTSIINSQLLLCFMKLVKDSTTFSTFGNLYGMISGFLAGAYLPYHMYPGFLKKVLIFYPQTHLTSMMRQMYLKDFSKSLEGSQMNSLCKKLFDVFGVNIKWNNAVFVGKEQFCIIILFFCMFLIILKLSYRR